MKEGKRAFVVFRYDYDFIFFLALCLLPQLSFRGIQPAPHEPCYCRHTASLELNKLSEETSSKADTHTSRIVKIPEMSWQKEALAAMCAGRFFSASSSSSFPEGYDRARSNTTATQSSVSFDCVRSTLMLSWEMATMCVS